MDSGDAMKQIRLRYNLDLEERSTWLTATVAPSVRSAFVYVQELGDFYCGPDYFTSREYLPSYLIKYCVQGEGLLRYDGATYDVTPGTFFWIDCTHPQYYQTHPESDSLHLLWVHLYGPTTQAYYEAFLEHSKDSPIAAVAPEFEIDALFARLFGLYADGNNTMQDDIQASSLLTQLMAGCVLSAVSHPAARQSPNYATSIKAYIDRNINEDISLESLSKEFSINKFYLQKLFKRYTGLTPNDYLTRARLARAKQLLRTTDDTMTEIAQTVGYTATYFDKIFKKYEGITPRSYRLRWYNSDPSMHPRE